MRADTMQERDEESRSKLSQFGDTPPEEFRKQLHELADWIADFRENIEQLRVAPDDKPGAIRARLPKHAPEEGEPFEKILADVDHIIVPGMVHWSHPMFLGYFGWTSTAPGILGEILTAPLNVNAMTWRTCPAATELEIVVVDWLRQWIGLSDEFEGVIYDTASVGIMHALAVAREEAAPATRKLGLTDRDLPRLRIYTSDQAHSSAEKAGIALGLGEENVIRIPSDDQFRIDVNSLGRSIAADQQNGLQPMAVVATVGTTSTASVDPVRDIGNVCREAKIWLHIDAAYGGGFAMLPEYEWIRKGWELADSIVINPHKTLFVPLDFSVLYMRDLARLRRVFSLVPEYLRGDTVEAEKNYMDYGIQLGRRCALKAWVIWRSLGRAGVVARLREQIRLANLLADWIKTDGRFELSTQPSMGVVCFRFVGRDGPPGRPSSSARPAVAPCHGEWPNEVEVGQLNSDIVERINASGRAYLTQTKLRGRTVVRIGLGNVLTTEEHLRKGWEIIQEAAAAL
ncbi:MAG: amino acid decarboxylase [Verrucomicrobia bacterium]|nr:MAG: amino acid decarboxylase [Verrucomicrobiota bacterium]